MPTDTEKTRRYKDVFSVSLQNDLDALDAVVARFGEVIEARSTDVDQLVEAAERICEKDREAHKTLIELALYRRKPPSSEEHAGAISVFEKAEHALSLALGVVTDPGQRAWCEKYLHYVSERLNDVRDPLRLMRYVEQLTTGIS